ncbi:MAG: DUF115 domain-containing protein [Treponema sp.]|jgi:hypothetical protein|nr:DUF115 domain-containing protein [Treponema sp.]
MIDSPTLTSNTFSEDAPRQLPARRGFSVFYKNKTLLSRIDPIAQAERLVASLSVSGKTLYVCPSPLYAYGLASLLERLDADSAILCVEADEQLFALAHEALGALHDSRVCLVFAGCGVAPLRAFVKKRWGSRAFQCVHTLRLTVGWQLFPALYEELVVALRRDLLTDLSNAMTLTRLGRLYIRNAIRNLPFLAHSLSFDAIATRFGAAPVLVLGAGPSLDPVLDRLAPDPAVHARETRPFRIVCVDTSLGALRARDIPPDLVVALESQHWNLRDFVGLGGWNAPLAMDLSALPATKDTLGSELALFATEWTPLRFFTRLKAAGLMPETFPPLGSVGLSATAIALRVSTGPLIVAGLDFSFTLDHYHARDTPSHRELLRRQSRLNSPINAAAAFRAGTFIACSKSGLPTRSDPALNTYRNLFEDEFSGEARLYDIEGPGLSLGLKTLSMQAALALLQKASPSSVAPSLSPHIEASSISSFIQNEVAMLHSLKAMLCGDRAASPEELEPLLLACDYLWAHFPDRAGKVPPSMPLSMDISFLKRVRVEIDFMLRLFS